MKKTRLDTEKETLRTMIALYCKGHRHPDPLCADCRKLLEYSIQKLEVCVFGNRKSFCSKCQVHCYEPDMRERVRNVMRYAGPRMLWHAPVMALKHAIQK